MSRSANRSKATWIGLQTAAEQFDAKAEIGYLCLSNSNDEVRNDEKRFPNRPFAYRLSQCQHARRGRRALPLRKIRAAITSISGMMKVPLTTADAVRSVLDELAERSPKAKEQNPGKFFDDRFVHQLQSSDFIEPLYH